MRIAIIGTGLIGASVGLAARREGHSVAGFDPDERALAVAFERGAVDEAAASLERVLDGADLSVVAAPVAQLVHTVEAVLAASLEGCSVTDVGSTKARVAAAAPSPRFVGGHPVCGSEAHGPAHARADLFEGASWFLTPSPQTSAATHRLVHGFVASLGATPVAVDPTVHDRLVALTSHLPHALANLLVNQAGAARIDGHEPLAAAAGGSLRDMTRVAGSNPRIWVDIFLENSGADRRGARSSTAAASSSWSKRSTPATPASSHAGSARRVATAGACWRRRTPTSAPSSSCASTSPTAPVSWRG